MNFDIVRSWKDEAYRQSLNTENLPANPAGELNDTQLEQVFGGDSPDYSDAAAASSSSFNALASNRHHHTWAGLCDIGVFSATVPLIPILSHLLVIGKCNKQTCADSD
jgi:mersacidin/lichenicidin family type 2 lantibiotic